MDIITDDYSRQVGRRAIAKHNERIKHMSYQFTPETLAGFTVKMDDVFNLAPPKDNNDYIRRVMAQRAELEQNKQTKQVVNQQTDVDIQQIREQLKDPNLPVGDADVLFEAMKKLEYSKLEPNDPQLVKKQEVINKNIENMRRERAIIVKNYGVGLTDVIDKLQANNNLQIQAIHKFGSIENAIRNLEGTFRGQAQKQLDAGFGDVVQPFVYDDQVEGVSYLGRPEALQPAEAGAGEAKAGDADDIEIVARDTGGAGAGGAITSDNTKKEIAQAIINVNTSRPFAKQSLNGDQNEILRKVVNGHKLDKVKKDDLLAVYNELIK